MNRDNRQAITLIELLISIVLLAMVIVGFMSIDTFSRHHLVSSDRRAKLQNEAALILEHMTKQLIGVIGDSESDPIIITPGSGGNTEKVVGFIDDFDGIRGDSDNLAQYCFGSTDCGGTGAQANILSFQLYNNTTKTADTDSREILSRRVAFFNASMDYVNSRNYLDVTVTTCWDPDGAPAACKTPDNPAITMNTTVKLPSVSIK